MDMLQRELERKKKAVREAKRNAGGSEHHRSRYMKAGDLRRHQEEQEELQQSSKRRKLLLLLPDDDTAEESPSQKQSNEKVSSDDGPNTTRNISQSQHQHSSSLELLSSSSSSASLTEIQQQLRSLGLPVTLFGERTSIEKRRQRLHEAERALRENQLHRSEADEFRLGQGHGIRNPFLEKEDSAAYTDQALRQAEAAAAFRVPNPPRHSSGTDKGDEGGTKTKAKQPHDKRGGGDKDNDEEHDDTNDDDDPHKLIYKHFKGLLQQWEADLNARSDDVKRTVAGRNETKTLKQCRDYIRPLFKLCKRRQLEDSMVHKLSEMVHHCRAGEFVRAHDAYMDLAIGRSAWPIGVTQVGIHSRTGREKIGANNVAHVMNSELQRKYLTSVKRLLTFEQNKRTDVDPSKKVMN